MAWGSPLGGCQESGSPPAPPGTAALAGSSLRCSARCWGRGGGQTVGCGFLACPALSMKDKYSTKAQGAGLPGWSRGHGPWRPQRGQSFPTAK